LDFKTKKVAYQRQETLCFGIKTLYEVSRIVRGGEVHGLNFKDGDLYSVVYGTPND